MSASRATTTTTTTTKELPPPQPPQPATASLARPRSQVFVEIPLSSSFLSARPHPTHPTRVRSAPNVKENAPLALLTTNGQGSMTTDVSAASKKRKSSDGESSVSEDPVISKTKKAKLSASASQPTVRPRPAAKSKAKEHVENKETEGTEEVEEFPNGHFYCHQCCRKRDSSVGIQCTWKRVNAGSKAQPDRCRARYCRACLKNRYQQDMDDIVSRGISGLPAKQREQHVLTDGFYYKCPRCRDECNCRTCRKAKGLEPTGNFNVAARKAEKAAAAEKAKKESASAKTKGTKAKSQKSSKASQQPSKVESSKGAKAKAKPKPKPAKPIPKPVWTRVATDLTLDDAQARIHIREFVVRFASLLQLPHTQLEELDEISGDNLGEASEWEGPGEVEIISWVSDICAKGIIQGLLDVIAADAEATGDRSGSKALREAAKNVKASGANLNRVWAALVTLRETLGERPAVTFSDPLPPPASTIIRTTRQNRDLDIVHISNSAQLIPVISDLIEATIGSSAIRDVLDAGTLEEKEYGKLSRETIAAENNRWKEAKDAKTSNESKKGEAKALRDRHQQTLEDLEYAGRLASLRCISRVSPLGRDTDGRVYFAMTPGAGESDASISLLKGKDGRVKVGRKKGGFMEEDRKEMERWNWFVAVWGRKPQGAEVAKRDIDEDEESEDDSDEECWWGFWQPQEIQKMAEWLAIKSNLEDDTTIAATATTANANSSAKVKGARNRTSTGTSSLSSLSSSRVSSLSDISDMSDFSDDDEESRVNLERPLGHKREVAQLVNGLKDFADLLQWRIRRAASEASHKPVKETSKAQAIPANRFYA